MFIVFKVYGKTTPYNYYGYSRLHDVKEAFTLGAERTEAERGDVRFLAANGGDVNKLMFEELDSFDNELEAWASRNDYRAKDPFAFTGPSVFPTNIARRVAKQFPEKMADWQQAMVMRSSREKAKTARQAWAAGRWTADAVKGLIGPFKKEDVARDLDKCTPDAFAAKYAL